MEILDFPPVFRPVVLREVQDAFARACGAAAEVGAGALFWVGRFDRVDLAVVLEPEAPLRHARPCFYAGMNALADASAAYAPPEAPVSFSWPDRVMLDGALVGGGRLGCPPSSAEDVPPDWLVFGATLRRVSMGPEEPGWRPTLASLEEVGVELGDHGAFVARFARFFLLALHEWTELGPEAALRRYVPRLGGQASAAAIGGPAQGRWTEGRLADALEKPSWLEGDLAGWL